MNALSQSIELAAGLAADGAPLGGRDDGREGGKEGGRRMRERECYKALQVIAMVCNPYIL